MAAIVLIIHLIICIGLIGLVLLQRSEGGALGMGGGGGGSLMSGRGAADALARLTSIAGGMFLATSLGLTFISGAASSAANRSVFDIAPLTRGATTPAPAADPLETSAAPAIDPTEISATAPAPASEAGAPVIVAPPPNAATARAGPVTGSTQPASAPATSAPTLRPTTAAPTQTAPRPAATAQPAAQRPAVTAPRPAATTPAATAPAAAQPVPAEAGESGDAAPTVEVVRRERAGPDQ